MSFSVLAITRNNRYSDENTVIAEGKPVLVGGGTDGASVNDAEHNGMNGMILNSHPWLV